MFSLVVVLVVIYLVASCIVVFLHNFYFNMNAFIIVTLYNCLYACASNFFFASISWLVSLMPPIEGEHTSRGSSHPVNFSKLKFVGITFLILQKRGEVNINSLN